MLIDLSKIWRKRGTFNVLNRSLELHLDFLNLSRLLLFFSLEIEVIDVLGVKRFDPL